MRTARARPISAAARSLWLGPACLLAACSTDMAATTDSPGAYPEPPRFAAVEAPRIEPIPPIPVALRGCWDAIPPEDPDEPGGPHRLLVTATTVELVGEGRVATAEFVERVTPTSIEGRFSAPAGESRATVATRLSLGDGAEGGPVDELRRAEGDAGSTFYTRCRK